MNALFGTGYAARYEFHTSVLGGLHFPFCAKWKMDEILEMKLKTDRENTPVKARARETQAQSL